MAESDFEKMQALMQQQIIAAQEQAVADKEAAEQSRRAAEATERQIAEHRELIEAVKMAITQMEKANNVIKFGHSLTDAIETLSDEQRILAEILKMVLPSMIRSMNSDAEKRSLQEQLDKVTITLSGRDQKFNFSGSRTEANVAGGASVGEINQAGEIKK